MLDCTRLSSSTRECPPFKLMEMLCYNTALAFLQIFCTSDSDFGLSRVSDPYFDFMF